MNSFRKQSGFTLIELTVVLSVLIILTLVLSPQITSLLVEIRTAEAQKEAAAIKAAILRFYDDTGFLPKTRDSIDGRMGSQFVDLLVSKGFTPRPPAGPVTNSNGSMINADITSWITGTTDLLDNQLQKNIPGYLLKGGPNPMGWNGPYLSAPEIPADPWGNRYMVNIRFLEASIGQLYSDGQVKLAVWVISAGPNGIIETPFAQPSASAEKFGDDIVEKIW
jgi:prepilin-type N-terminal cleavage/methylation domain-containing protein